MTAATGLVVALLRFAVFRVAMTVALLLFAVFRVPVAVALLLFFVPMAVAIPVLEFCDLGGWIRTLLVNGGHVFQAIRTGRARATDRTGAHGGGGLK